MNRINISDIKIGKRFRRDVGDIKPLMSSIKNTTLLHPIVIDQNNELVAGFRRIQMAKASGWKTIPFTRVKLTKEQSLLAQIDENKVRKNFTATEIADISRWVESHKRAGRPKKGAKLAPFPRGKTNIVVEQLTGVSHGTINKIKTIEKAARQHPKKYGKLLEQIDNNIHRVDSAYNKIIIDRNKKLPKLNLPAGKYNLIIWDPSWPHENEIAGGNGKSGNAQKYRPETIEEMKNRGLQDVLADDAILGIWSLPTFHSEVLEVIRNNGFEKIKTKIYWDKMVNGMGYNFRNVVEELCICVRGNVKAFHLKDQPNIIHQKPQGRIHSRKPDVFFDIMERAAMAGLPRHKLSKLEINATKPRPGWVQVGNQLEVITA